MHRPPQMAYRHMRRSAVSADRFDNRNRLESGKIRVNMLTRRFGFPCIGRMAKNFRADFELFMEKKKISFPFK